MKIIYIILFVIYDLVAGGLFMFLADSESSVTEKIIYWCMAVLWPVLLVVRLVTGLFSRAE